MKRFPAFALVLVIVLVIGCAGQPHAADPVKETVQTVSSAPAAPAAPTQNFRHIVIWDFKKGLSATEKDTLFTGMKRDLEKLPGVIPGIIELRVMRDPYNPGLNGEGQIVLDAIYESQAAYSVYATHPSHLEIAVHVRDNIVDNRRGGNFLLANPTKHSNKYRHIVIWEYKSGMTDEAKTTQFNRMKKDLEGLVGVIPGLIEMNIVRDHVNLDGNGQVILIAEFGNRDDHMVVYTPHPEHQKIAGYVVADIVDNSTRRQGNFMEQY